MKPSDGVLDLTVRTPTKGVGRQFELKPAGIPPGFGLDLHSVRQRAHGAGTARVPIDAPGGAWEIVPANEGEHFVQVSQRVPLVLHAPSYWSLPQICPVVPVYFTVPADAENALIFFEGPAKLFDPEGNVFGVPEGVRGEVPLPGDRPGLWRFEPVSNRLVRGWNFPPFFAMGSPEFYFEPAVPWEPQPLPPAPIETPEDTLYVPGPIEDADDQALFLGGRRVFTLDGGGEHPEGNGSRFLPHRAGTIEFFFKPDWSTFDLGEETVSRTFVRVATDASPWTLQYRIDPEGTTVNLGPKDPSHSFYGSMRLENGAHLRVWRTQTIFERAEWVHLAFVWGPELRYGPRREKLNLMVLRMYVNGKGTAATIFRSSVDMLAAGQPQSLTIGPLEGAAIAQLRISDIQRYTEDFTSVFTRQPACDEHTRAVFRFHKTLDGESCVDGDSPVGVLNE
jgi:hypothetical protein